MTKTSTLWKIVSCDWVDKDPDLDVIAISVKGPGGLYAVVCSGHKGMKSDEFITAIRAAAAGLIVAGGGDLSVVGAATLEDSKFDTGNQRPS